MARAWQAVMIFRTSLGVETEQVLPVDQERSVLNGRNRMLYLTRPWRDRTGFSATGLREIHYGYRDGGVWDEDDEFFGGYLGEATHKKEAGEYVDRLYLDDYETILDRVTVRGYPTDPLYLNPFDATPNIRTWHQPALVGEAVDGYPVGYTPAQWIATGTAGSQPFDSLVKTYVPNVDIGTVDTAFTSTTLELDSRPGNTSILGHMEGLSLRGAIELVLLTFGMLAPTARPFYTLRPKVSGSTIVPEFVLRDLNDIGSADWEFSDADSSQVHWSPSDAPGTVYAYFEDFEVKERFRNYQNRVTVFGRGRNNAGVDAFLEPIYSRVIGEHVGTLTTYPSKYPALQGWDSEPVLTDLPTIEACHNLAVLLVNALSVVPTVITYTTYAPVKKGQVISIDDTSTGISGLFPVLDVSANGVLRQYTVTAGWQVPTREEILNGPQFKLLMLAAIGITRNKGGVNSAGMNFNNANLPAPRGLSGAPNSSYHNAVAALSDNVIAFRPDAATNVSQETPDRMPIGTATDNYLSTPIPDPPLRPALLTDYLPMPRYMTRDPATGAITEWDAQDGYNHPFHWHYTFDENGVEDVWYPTKVFISTVAVVREYDENNVRVLTPSASVNLLLENVTTHAMEAVSPAVDPTHPIFLDPAGDRALQVEVTSLEAGRTVKVEVSERGIDPGYFGLLD